MAQDETTSQDFTWRVVAAILLPFVAESAYALLSRWPSSRFTTASDFVAFALAILVGAALIWTLPLRLSRRVLALLLYIPVVAASLFMYALILAALVFGDGL
jgi:hypothetical protein